MFLGKDLPPQLADFLAQSETDRKLYFSLSEPERKVCSMLTSPSHFTRFLNFSSQYRHFLCALTPTQMISFLEMSEDQCEKVVSLSPEQAGFILNAPRDDRVVLLSVVPHYYGLLSSLSVEECSRFCKLPADHRELALLSDSSQKLINLINIQDSQLLVSLSAAERAMLLDMPEKHRDLLQLLSAEERRSFMQASLVNIKV